MKVVVINGFTDTHTKERYKEGDMLDLTDFRAGELFAKGKVRPIEDSEKTEKKPAKEKAEHKPAKEKEEK